jgi:DNA-binding response OmpR family regulator
VLDLGLPRRDGIDVLKGLRERHVDVPVLVMTARDTVRDRIKGLDAGADDYLVKPFDLDELTARARALIRRAAGRSEPVIEHGALVINPATREVTWQGAAVALSAREYALLAALAERPGLVLSRAQLEEKLYGWNESVGSNAVEVHIHNVRKKLGDGVIRNVRGLGYTLASE